VARAVTGTPGTLTTRPVRFSGAHAFVNADVTGEIKAEVIGADGRAIDGFTLDRSRPVTGNGTRLVMTWTGSSLARLAGTPVRFRFHLKQARLYAFWVSRSERGESGGYVAAGGPGFSGETDV
jgi:hypothetical protein